MRRLAAILFGLLAIAGAAVLLSGAAAAGSSSATFDVIFDDARGLVAGQLVKVAGAQAGTIQNVTVTADFKARVEASIDSRFMPFHQDATCTIRPQGLIGENYVECDPGSAGSPPLRAGGGQPPTVPVSHTTEPVSLLDLFGIFNAPTRQRLTVLINELGIATSARGQDLNDVLRRANPTLAAARQVIGILSRQRAQLATIVDATNTIAASAAAHTPAVQSFLDRTAALTALDRQPPHRARAGRQSPAGHARRRPAGAEPARHGGRGRDAAGPPDPRRGARAEPGQRRSRSRSSPPPGRAWPSSAPPSRTRSRRCSIPRRCCALCAVTRTARARGRYSPHGCSRTSSATASPRTSSASSITSARRWRALTRPRTCCRSCCSRPTTGCAAITPPPPWRRAARITDVSQVSRPARPPPVPPGRTGNSLGVTRTLVAGAMPDGRRLRPRRPCPRPAPRAQAPAAPPRLQPPPAPPRPRPPRVPLPLRAARPGGLIAPRPRQLPAAMRATRKAAGALFDNPILVGTSDHPRGRGRRLPELHRRERAALRPHLQRQRRRRRTPAS